MREVKVMRDDLLVKVKVNRDKHIAEYNDAVDGYKEQALKSIDDAVARLRGQIAGLKSGEMLALTAIMFSLPVPQSHQKDYDQVIQMLEMSVDPQLSIRSDEFACYVMDDWEWKADFRNTTAGYSNKKY